MANFSAIPMTWYKIVMRTTLPSDGYTKCKPDPLEKENVMKPLIMLQLLFVFLMIACVPEDDSFIPETEPELDDVEMEMELAAITSVSVTGNEGAYTFAVEITSPDEGCEQYADWWEVVTLDGNLVHRRVLGHSHVNEQPFTRSGGPISLSVDQEVWVRVHMNNTGYSLQAYKGSVAIGFASANTADEFASELETEAPLPERCAF